MVAAGSFADWDPALKTAKRVAAADASRRPAPATVAALLGRAPPGIQRATASVSPPAWPSQPAVR
jgi:hypothetical protein